jgi:hypothetical protein
MRAQRFEWIGTLTITFYELMALRNTHEEK